MTTVAIKYSQATLDALTTYRQSNATPTMAAQASQFIKAGYEFSASHYYYDYISLEAASGWLSFSDGAFQYFSAMSMTGTTSGVITATVLEDVVPFSYNLQYEGEFKFGYTNTPDVGIVLSNQGGTISSVTLKTLLTTDDPQYDTTLGNHSTTLKGTLASSNGSEFSGTVTSLETTADQLLTSSKVTGNFAASGNATEIGQGSSVAAFSGTMASLSQTYADGSTFDLSSPLTVTGSEQFDERMLTSGTNFGGDDTISVSLPASLTTAFVVNAMDGNDQVTVTGGSKLLTVNGGKGNDKITVNGGGQSLINGDSGNDTITLADHGHKVDGGDGADLVVFSGARSSYTVAISNQAGNATTVSTVATGSAAADVLSNVERIQFSDTYVALDINANAGQVYRLYQAAFNRTPDSVGLGYWIKNMDAGLTLSEVANYFTLSPEYQHLYGAVPNNADLVTSLYNNALHRAPDPGGFAFYLDVLNQHHATAIELLVNFSESVENQSAVLSVIGKGIAYTPYIA